jgi:hypothetical protein
MPRLNPVFARSVFFLFGTDTKTGKRIGPLGTGVIVGLPREYRLPYLSHYYAVTCAHLLTSHAHDIRLNLKDGSHRFIEKQPDEWQLSKTGDDLAAIDIADDISVAADDISALPTSLLLSREFAASVEIGLGEDGFMLGLFADHFGTKRNLVAARFGNVALLSREDEPLTGC